MIEGILHYPPEKFQSKNLPLLVLIHGGPYSASLNKLEFVWHNWASLAASEGWLVLEPNYRGSTGYGDQFLNEVRYKPLSRPGKDILCGVDQLIKDGIVDSYRLAIGGYSYGGFLTNWLITQTRRFNAALSGAGAIDHTSSWGMTDIPVHLGYLFGGFPWEVSNTYQNEAPIYQLDRIRTPTHIVTGEHDNRVPTSQSYILERGLYYLGIPVKLISFPKEGHSMINNPWYGKIKVREELKWLQKYGNQSLNKNELSNGSEKSKLTYLLHLSMFLFSFVIIKSV
jgi:dipeptidyl aminopeptidase/acylaminoacyl peptidase